MCVYADVCACSELFDVESISFRGCSLHVICVCKGYFPYFLELNHN